MEITLTTEISRTGLAEHGTRTLAEAFADLKAKGMIRLLSGDEEELSERAFLFEQAIRRGEVPSIGETLAAWYVARIKEIDAEWMADETMSNRSYAARKAAAGRLVFRRN